MKSFEKTYHIDAPIDDVWQALVNPPDIKAWSGEDAEMSEIEGSKFSLWGGDVWGTNKEVTRPTKLVQEWYGGKWDKPSHVTITLTADEGTKVTINQTDIPDNEFEDIKTGWDNYYFGPLKEYIEGK